MLFRSRFRTRIVTALALLLLLGYAPIVFAQADVVAEDSAIAAKLFGRGQDAHARGEWQTALAAYEAALKLRPEFPEAEYQRGAALASLKRLPEAEKAFRRAIELRPDWALPLASLGALLEHADRFDEAEQVLTRALASDKGNAVALLALTNLRLRTKPSHAALETLLKQLQNVTTTTASNTQAALLWMARGRIERALDDQSSALASFTHTLAIDPANAMARVERAQLRAKAGDYVGAIEDAQAARRNAETAADASTLLKVFYEQALNDAQGRAMIEKLLAQGTADAALYARLGESYRTTNPAHALQLFRRAAELEPRNADYATGYAAALVQSRRFIEARDILRRIIGASPDNYAAHANLATALYELKTYAEALPEYEWIAHAKPDLAATYFFIGSAHDFIGELPEALAAYEKFLARADAQVNKLEIEKVELRLPTLRNQIKQRVGMKKRKAS